MLCIRLYNFSAHTSVSGFVWSILCTMVQLCSMHCRVNARCKQKVIGSKLCSHAMGFQIGNEQTSAVVKEMDSPCDVRGRGWG